MAAKAMYRNNSRLGRSPEIELLNNTAGVNSNNGGAINSTNHVVQASSSKNPSDSLLQVIVPDRSEGQTETEEKPPAAVGSEQLPFYATTSSRTVCSICCTIVLLGQNAVPNSTAYKINY